MLDYAGGNMPPFHQASKASGESADEFDSLESRPSPKKLPVQ